MILSSLSPPAVEHIYVLTSTINVRRILSLLEGIEACVLSRPVILDTDRTFFFVHFLQTFRKGLPKTAFGVS